MTNKQIQVLLLEDEAAHAEAIRRALESADSPLKVHIVGSLKEFRDYVAANTPDIALIDMVLPDGNGIDLLTASPEANAFPMLMLTSHGNEQAAVAALRAGALDYIVKSPETFTNMPHILTVALHQWSLIQQNKKAQQDLQVSEKNFRNSMDNSPLGIRVVSEDGETSYTNRAFLDIYCYKDMEEFKTTSVKDRYTPESYVEFHQRREKRRRHEPLPDTYEVSIIRKDGTVRQLQVIRKEIIWAGKRQYQTIYQDITERQQMTQRINELNNILQLIKSINQLIVKIDNESELLQQACREFVASRQYLLAWVGFKQEGSYDICPSVQCGEAVDYLASIRITWDDSPSGRGPTGTAVKTGKLSVMRDVLHDPRFVPWRAAALKAGFKSVVALPLVVRDEVIGTLNLYSASAVAFGKTELDLLSELAWDLSLGIEKIRFREERLRDEEALKESEDRFRYVFDYSAIGKSLTSISGVIHVNKAFCDMLGYSQEELANKSWLDITHTDDIELTQKAADSLVTGKEQTVRFIKRYVHKNGSDVWTDVQSSLRRNKNGKPLYLITSIMDITERKRAEEEIRQSEAKYSTLVEKSNDGIVIIENGIIQFINTKLEAMTGFTSHEALGRKFIDFSPPEERELLMKRHMKRMSGEKVTEIYETLLVARDGRHIPVEINATNTIYQECPVVLAFIRDITDRKQAEEAIRESERRYHDLFESTSDIIQSVSLDGHFVFVNRAWHEVLGYSESELSQLNLFKIVHPESLSHCQELFSRVIAGESVGNIQATFVAKDGRPVYVEGNATARSIGGKIVATHGFFCDITERKRAEEALKESEGKYRLIVEKSNDVLFTFNPAGEFLYISPSIKNLLGYNPADLIGRTFASLVHPDDLPGLQQAIQRNIRDGSQTPGGNRYRVRHASGEWRWHNAAGNAIFNTNGQFLSFVGIARDITERQLAEEALQESETRYHQLVDTITSGVIIYKAVDNGEDFVFVDVNNAAEKMEGINRKDVIGKKVTEVLPGSRGYPWFTIFQRVWQTGNSEYYSSGEGQAESAKGRWRDNWTYKLPGGEIVNVYDDITERKQAEEALKTSEQNFRNSMDSSSMGIRIMGDADYTLYANQAILDIFGYQNIEELRASPPQEHYTPESYAGFIRRKSQFARGELLPDTLEFDIIRKDGAIRHIQLSSKHVLWNGKEQNQILYNDITERKQAEEALKVSEQNFRNSLDNSPMGIRIVDLEGETLYTNQVLPGIFGYETVDEIISNPPQEYFTPESYAGYFLLKEKRLRGELIPDSVELDIVRKYGTMRNLQILLKDVVWNGKNQLQIIYNDITERKQAEEALKASEEKYSTLIEQSADGIVILNVHKIEFANRKMSEMFGFTQAEILGKHFHDLVAPEYEKMLIQSENRKRAPGVPNTLELGMLCKDGRRILADTRSLPIVYKGRPVRMVIIRDITERKRAEEALKASEQNFRNSIDSSSLGIRISDIDNNTLYANQTLLDIFGYKNMDELKSAPPQKYYSTESYADYLKMMEKYGRGEIIPDHVDIDIIRKDSAVRHLQALFKEVFWDGKQQYQSLYNDITENKKVEVALRESEEKYRTIFESANDILMLLDTNGKIVDINGRLKDIGGYERQELIGKNILGLTHIINEKNMAIVVANLQKTVVGNGMVTYQVEMVKKNQELIFMEINAVPIQKEGKVVGVLGILRDITDRKQAEEALHESEEKYRLIVENTRDIIFIANVAGEYVYVSPSVKEILGYNQNELVGKLFLSLVHPEDRHILEEETARAGVSGYQTSGDSEYRTRHASGEWRWVVSRGTRVADANGNFLYFIGIMRDITANKQAEKEKQILEEKAQINSRLAAVGEMAAGIAHEINNPLTGVLGFSQMLLENKNVPEDIKENLKLIADGSQRVAEIVKRLLTFARQSKPIKAMANLNELIENTLKLREYVLKTNNINVVTRFDPELPWSIVDPGQMQQVFLNLIVNAEQAMKKAHGKGTLTITTKKIDNNIRILFHDDGPGITAENMGHLFEPFFTTKEPGEGTGLGLSLSRSIILEHDGKMSAESEFGRGAIFIIELPIIEALLSEAETAASSVKAQPEATKPGRILVIDDEAGVRTLIEKTLTRMGHSVDVIDDAGAALDIIDAGTVYDVILTDVRMPGMSGIELYPLIIRRMPSMKNRIIFITGDVMDLDIRTFLNQNNLPYLSKPFDIELLKEKINAILEAGQT